MVVGFDKIISVVTTRFLYKRELGLWILKQLNIKLNQKLKHPTKEYDLTSEH